MDYTAVIHSPFGRLGLVVRDRHLTSIDFLSPRAALRPAVDPLARRAVAELQHYFTDPGWQFQLPLAPAGTDFQQRVWSALREIPSGATRTYGALAARLGSGARAVGGACRRNPLPIVIPCHRVVAAQGLGGYSGETDGPVIAVKRALLAHEDRST